MATNDVLDLILTFPEGEPDAIAWRRATPLVEATEAAMAASARALIQTRHFLAEPNKEVAATVYLAATPRVGSLILPLIFHIPHLAEMLLRPLSGQLGDQESAIRDAIGALADAATVMEFARDLMFGERGVLARLRRQAPPRPPETAHERALDVVAPAFLNQLTDAAERLMETAERTGCVNVEVRVNDQTAISLIRTDRARLPSRLVASNISDQAEHQVRVARTTEPVRVMHDGKARLAFASRMDNGANRQVTDYVVTLWNPAASLPELSVPFSGKDWYLAKGRFVERESLIILDDIPTDWPKARGAFLVERFQPNPDWQT